MSAQNGLALLNSKDINISYSGSDLLININSKDMTQELKQFLKSKKYEIIDYLKKIRLEENKYISVFPDLESLALPFNLSDLQQGFYMANDDFFEHHVRPHYYCEYNHENLNIELYEQAVNKVFLRHKKEIVLLNSNAELSLINNPGYIRIKINNLCQFDEAATNNALLDTRAKMERSELPLDRWPWFDLEISVWVASGEKKYRIHYNHNNFYSDGVGANIFLDEIKKIYKDIDTVLPELHYSLRDSILALDKLSKSSDGEKAKKYWLDRIPYLPEPPNLPKHPSVNTRSRSYLKRREGEMSKDLWSSFKNMCSVNGLTPTAAIIAIYCEVIGHWSNNKHFILSNMTTRRLPLHPEIMNIIGNFASLYPLEVDLREARSFIQRAQILQKQILKDASHREWGGMQVMQALNHHKGVIGRSPCPFVVGSGLFLSEFERADYSCLETSQTVLDHQFWELRDGSYFYVWDLIESYFPPDLINQMWDSYSSLLHQFATDINVWKKDVINFKKNNEKMGELTSSIKYDQNHGSDVCKKLSLTSTSFSAKIGLVYDGVNYTYEEIQRLSNKFANFLISKNIGEGDVVAVLLSKGLDLLISILGTMKAGAAFVPIDNKLPLNRINYMLENSNCRIAITNDNYQENVNGALCDLIQISSQFYEALDDQNFSCITHDRLAYIIYTSGSTGDPKGVAINHYAVSNTIDAINNLFCVESTDVILGVSSIGFDLSIYDIFGAVSVGATLVYPNADLYNDADHWLELLASTQVTIWNSAPQLMMLVAEIAQRRSTILPALRLVLLSGDWIPLELISLIKKTAPNAKIVSLGGATEASIWSIYYVVDSIKPEWKSIPYGYSLPGQCCEILDEDGRSCPLWTIGDIYISGNGLSTGYWRDEPKTLKSFIKNKLTGEVKYKTGDLGRLLPDGSIELIGRSDYQIKVRGYRVELGEIESALRDCKQIKEAVAIVVGKGNDARLVAYVIPYDLSDLVNQEIFISQIKSQLLLFLPDYMVPSHWAILDFMPLTQNGKVDRNALLLQHSQSFSERKVTVDETVETETQAVLLTIWKSVLKLNKLSIFDDFFEVGGQSFDAIRCISLIKENFHFNLSLREFWQNRTIHQLASILEKGDENTKHLHCIKQSNSSKTFYFVHPAGGQITSYFPLADHLDGQIYGFSYEPLNETTAINFSIEEIANVYVEELIAKDNSSSYNLAGWSSGACIAFEMALQLERKGKEVKNFIIFDSPPPNYNAALTEQTLINYFLEDSTHGVVKETTIDRNLIDASVDRKTLFELALSNESISGLSPTDLYRYYLIFRAVVIAVRAYKPSDILDHTNIIVFRASEGIVTEYKDYPNFDKPDWGWSVFSKLMTNSEVLYSSHYDLFNSPSLIKIAARLNLLS